MSSSSTAGIPAVPGDPDGTKALAGAEALAGTKAPAGAEAPDVTVVVAVCEDGRPRLGRCLASLAGQTIGAARIEVLVTGGPPQSPPDGAGPAPSHAPHAPPHDQPWASSGAARSPSPADLGAVGRTDTANQALERARGRYLFFLDAADLLGREALARLVHAADSKGHDVVYAKTAASGAAVFARTRHRVPLGEPGLAWELSAAKLFRREPLLRHGLRFAEDVPVGLAEQAFTLEALFRARRVAVLADYDYRFAGGAATGPVRRSGPEARNSPAALAAAAAEPGGLEGLLRGTAAAMAVTARFTGPGPLGDGFRLRHFAHEGDVLTGPAFLKAPEPERRRVFAGVRRLVADHLGDAVLAGLRPGLRLRFSYVRAGDQAGLVSVLRYEAGHGAPPLRTDLVSADWRRTGAARRTLVVTARTPLPHLGALGTGPVRLTGCPEAGRVLLRPASGGAGTEIEVRIPAEAFPAGRTRIGLSTALLGTEHTAAVAPGTAPRQAHALRGLRPYRLDVSPDGGDGLVVAVLPVGLPVGLRRTERA
ncbi:glycosyltransferase family A protein [Streptomyces sp. ICN441]|uniref:glycosyltransferase family 2 protein n=1 Tax=Streptomyces sp. ICN441 TaxID=2558286 RepID=UPI001F10156B|nr:glycosyltransferase family A protein [Streptomyces sp. ICN441]